MKINIVTMNASYNYGAMLQAYSLQQNLIKLGYENSFVDLRKQKVRNVTFGKNPLINIFSFINRNALTEGYRNFEKFIEYEEILTENFASFDELRRNPPVADVYLTGSDQVWNPMLMSPANFLEFAPVGSKRISYAASIGVSNLPEDRRQLFADYVNKFDSISVREEKAKEIVSSVTDKEVNVNIDPVFLTSKLDWQKMQKQVSGIKKPYILCYILYRPKWLNAELKRLRKKTGFQIVLVDNSCFRNIYHDKMIRNAGPKEFLWLIDNAEMVVTSSFHGTAFSAIYEKEFYALVNPDLPTRIHDLLNKLGLSNRIVNDLSSNSYDVEYEKVGCIIEREKHKAISYLKQAIEGET